MKYFKITLLAFVAALCLCLVGVNATQYVKIRNIKSMLGNGGATGYRDLPQGTNVDFGNGTTEAGGYKLSLKSNKWLASTASAGINWDLGSLLFPNSVPYEVAGN